MNLFLLIVHCPFLQTICFYQIARTVWFFFEIKGFAAGIVVPEYEIRYTVKCKKSSYAIQWLQNLHATLLNVPLVIITTKTILSLCCFGRSISVRLWRYPAYWLNYASLRCESLLDLYVLDAPLNVFCPLYKGPQSFISHEKSPTFN